MRGRATLALLANDSSDPSRKQLRNMAMLAQVDERVMALKALAETGDPEALILFSTELSDEAAPVAVRAAAAAALGTCGPQAIPELRKALSADPTLLRASAASALGTIGEASLPEVLGALLEPASEEGALLALEGLPAWREAKGVREYVKRRVESATHFEGLQRALRDAENERVRLLADSVQSRMRGDGVRAPDAVHGRCAGQRGCGQDHRIDVAVRLRRCANRDVLDPGQPGGHDTGQFRDTGRRGRPWLARPRPDPTGSRRAERIDKARQIFPQLARLQRSLVTA